MGMDRLKKMMKQIEDVMAAATFAEEGMPAAAHSLLSEGRRVLLGLKEGRVDAKTLKYALNTSKRINAQLDILYVSSVAEAGSAPQDVELTRFQETLRTEGVPYRLISRTGCLKQQIIDHTQKDKEIAFAIIESPSSLDMDCSKKDRTLSELWQKLKCPLVVVMEEAKA
jgi:dethiobiotin synthetase